MSSVRSSSTRLTTPSAGSQLSHCLSIEAPMDRQVLKFSPAAVSHDLSFEQAQRALAHHNRARLAPGESDVLCDEHSMAALEESFLRLLRSAIAPWLAG